MYKLHISYIILRKVNKVLYIFENENWWDELENIEKLL